MGDFERTLAVIKPDAMKHKDTIIRHIKDAGFVIVQSRIVRLSAEQASEFYRSKQTHPNYHGMIVALSDGPILAMCISKERAIADLLWLIGPERYQDAVKSAPRSLRAMFADSHDELRNAIHGSEDSTSARFEIHFFFPNILLEPVFNEEKLNNYLRAMVNPVLMQGLYAMAKERPKNPVIWLSNWLLLNNPYKPQITSVLSDALYGINTKPELISEDRKAATMFDHMGAQSQCDCCEYKDNGICACSSLSIIAEEN